MQDINSLVSRLSTVQHFKNLSPADLTVIVTAGHVKHFHAEEIIYHEGEPCAGMFVLISGQVQLRIAGPQGQEHIMIVIDPVIAFLNRPSRRSLIPFGDGTHRQSVIRFKPAW